MSAPARTAPRLKLPPFGRELLEIRERGMVPQRGWCGAHVLIVVDSWEIAAARWRLVVPQQADPAGLSFLGCAGIDCIIIFDSRRTDGERLRATVRAVLRWNPSSLATFDTVTPHRVQIIKSHAVGIELTEFRDA